MKADVKIPRLAVALIAYLVSLAATLAVVPPEGAWYEVVLPVLAEAALMLLFGPYLLVTGFATGFLGEVAAWWGLLAAAPFYLAHVVFLAVLSHRTSLWRRLGRRGECARKSAVAFFALVSALGVWYEIPEVTRYDIAVDGAKIPPGGLRFAVVSDLHSCRYGTGQCALIQAIQAQKPDAVLLVGDIFDDVKPDTNTKTFLSAVAQDFPCFYVYGNHEYWSERIWEMQDILLAAGVTVVSGRVKTALIGGVAVDICGLDDPAGLGGEAWLAGLDEVAAHVAASPRLKILLSHRSEYARAYAQYGFDLVVSGHLHGGQWRVPGLDIGVCGPKSGGPDSSARMFFARHMGGAYKLNRTTTQVVLRGLARESTPLPRFFNHPEFAVVNLVARA